MDHPKQLAILVGPPGSGKSTLAKDFYSLLDFTRVSQDDQGKKGHMEVFENALKEGRDIVVDRMNFNKSQRERYIKPAQELGYKVNIIVMHVPLDTCMMRCRARKDHPTITDHKSASSAINTFFTKYERVQDDEGDLITRMGWESVDGEPKQECIWVDIDGTMADIEHRRPYLEKIEGKKPNWGKFFRAMTDDGLNQWCADITQMFALEGTPIVFATGRPADYHEQTYKWLYEHKLMHEHLFMRWRGDYRRDDIVKEIILEFEVKPRYDVKFAIDDRKQVVDMLRKHGLTVLQCAEGDF